jgi:tetratricopeptide (TPR) repeat protein
MLGMNMNSWKIPAVIIGVLIILGLGTAAFRSGAPGGFLSNITRLVLGAPGIPSLERPVVFPANFPEEVKEQYNTSLAELKSKITADPNDTTLWLDLAIRYRMVQDYDGAVEIWEYLLSQKPQDPIVLHNLGEHYFHYGRDYKRAEDYYRRAIEAAPQFSINYTDLFEMYRDVYKQDTSAAEEILKEGIRNISTIDVVDLQLMLARHYRAKGNIEGARQYYTDARQIAQSASNASLVRQIDSELRTLR